MIHNDEVEKIKAQISSLKARWAGGLVSAGGQHGGPIPL